MNNYTLKVFVWLTLRIIILNCIFGEIIFIEEFGESILKYVYFMKRT